MTTLDSCQLDERQMVATLRRDHPGPVTLVGVACNGHVAKTIRDEVMRARQRWQQPVHLVVDPRLRCHEIEVYCSGEAWAERCDEQERWKARAGEAVARM
jgi:hypothetical protein